MPSNLNSFPIGADAAYNVPRINISAKSHYLVNSTVNVVGHSLFGGAFQSDVSLLDKQTRAPSETSRLEAPSPISQGPKTCS